MRYAVIILALVGCTSMTAPEPTGCDADEQCEGEAGACWNGSCADLTPHDVPVACYDYAEKCTCALPPSGLSNGMTFDCPPCASGRAEFFWCQFSCTNHGNTSWSARCFCAPDAQ